MDDDADIDLDRESEGESQQWPPRRHKSGKAVQVPEVEDVAMPQTSQAKPAASTRTNTLAQTEAHHPFSQPTQPTRESQTQMPDVGSSEAVHPVQVVHHPFSQPILGSSAASAVPLDSNAC